MIEYLKEQQIKFEGEQRKCEDHANEKFSDLNRQIMLFVAILLPLSSFLLTDKDLIKGLDVFEKYLITVYLISLALSFILGSLQFFIDGLFWEKQHLGLGKAIKKIIRPENFTEKNVESKVRKIIDEEANSLPKKSSNLPITYSYFFLFVGLFSLVFFMLFRLYS